MSLKCSATAPDSDRILATARPAVFEPFLFLPSPHDALQAPDHRWLRCQHLLDSGRSPMPQDDPLVQDAYAFLYDWRRCRNDAQRNNLASAHPVLAQAVQIYQAAPLRLRAEVEARLLAGQDDASIADKCRLSPAVVPKFHELCFEVRPYLQASAYIVNLVIGPKVHHGLQFNDYDILLKIAGYTLGSSGVDELLAYWANPPACPVSLAQLDDAALESLRAKLRVQAWILSLTLPADDAVAAQLPAIRQVLTQAGVRGNHSTSRENNLLSACQPALDFRAFLSASEAGVSEAAAPASAGVASSVGESDGLDIPSLKEWQAVPA
jgi:hypothetical protein